MTTYSVYEPTKEAADPAARAEQLAFVKEGFNWPALFVPVLWLIYRRMWLELLAFLVAIAALPLLFGTSDAGREIAGWVTIGITVLFAFEANDLRSWSLTRRGYRFAGVASGRDRVEAERSFFTGWLPEQERRARRATVPAAARFGTSGPVAPTRPSGGEEVIGSFPRA